MITAWAQEEGRRSTPTFTPAGAAWPARYELLDGLRGLAALAVVLQHLGVASTGHLAVMVFFVISGYCITASAEASRRNGQGFGSFMMRRARRIYPPYLLAVAFYAATRLAKMSMSGRDDLQRPLVEWVQNLTLTQWVSDLFHPVVSADANRSLFVAAFWSLNYEEQFYLVMALILVLAAWRRTPPIVPVLILAVVGLAWNWAIPDGWVCGLFIEYWAHFAAGSLLYFALCSYTGRLQRTAFVALIAALGIACSARIALSSVHAGDGLRAMRELAFLSAVTLALYFLRPASAAIAHSRFWRPIAALGTVSYSLYLVHQFNLTLVSSIVDRVLPAATPYVLTLTAMIALHVGIGASFWYVGERPFLRRPVRAGASGGASVSTVPDGERAA